MQSRRMIPRESESIARRWYPGIVFPQRNKRGQPQGLGWTLYPHTDTGASAHAYEAAAHTAADTAGRW